MRFVRPHQLLLLLLLLLQLFYALRTSPAANADTTATITIPCVARIPTSYFCMCLFESSWDQLSSLQFSSVQLGTVQFSSLELILLCSITTCECWFKLILAYADSKYLPQILIGTTTCKCWFTWMQANDVSNYYLELLMPIAVCNCYHYYYYYYYYCWNCHYYCTTTTVFSGVGRWQEVRLYGLVQRNLNHWIGAINHSVCRSCLGPSVGARCGGRRYYCCDSTLPRLEMSDKQGRLDVPCVLQL